MIATSYDEYKYELKNYFRCFVVFVCYEYGVLFFEYENYLRRRNIKCVIFFRGEVFLEALLVACSNNSKLQRSGPRNVCSSYYRSIKMFCWNFLAVSHEKRIEKLFHLLKVTWEFKLSFDYMTVFICSQSSLYSHCLLD